MMNIVKLIVKIMLIVCAVIFLGVFILLKTVDLNRFKEQITNQITKSIGRDVAMKHVSFDFSVVQGITLHISGLSIMDNPDFSVTPMFYIDSSHLDLDVLSFVFKKQVFISKVEFNSLKVNLIRNSDGKINFEELARHDQDQPRVTNATGPSAPNNSPVKDPEGKGKEFDFSEMLIRSVRITDGTLIFTDHMTMPATMIPMTRIELDVTNVSMNAPFPFEVQASLFSKQQNIHFNGLAQIDARNEQIRIDDLKMQTELSDIIPDRLSEIPSFKDVGFQGKMEGKLAMDIRQMILGEDGLIVLSLDGQLTDGKIPLKDFPIPVENLNMRFKITESDMEIKEITMPLASGEIKMAGRIIEYLADQKLSGDLQVRDIQLGALAAQADFPVQLSGQIYTKFRMNGQGIDQKALLASLSGEGTGEVKNGKVVDLNILKLVLSKIAFIPNLAEKIEANLPEKYKEKLKAKDTVLEKVEIIAKINQGTLFINKAEANADGFLVIATGKMDFDQNINLNADFYIPSDLSASMIAASSELNYFLDEQKRIHIPLKPYNGKLERFHMYPDVEDIGKEIIRNKGKEELRKVIFKALDINDQPSEGDPAEGGKNSPEPTAPTDGNKTQERQPSPEEILINDILDQIPIFK